MKILHVAYSLSQSSAATRLAESQEELGNDTVFFLLGRVSSYEFVRKRQVTIVGGVIISLILRITDKIWNYFSIIPKSEFFSFASFYRPQGLLLKYTAWRHNIDVIHLHWGGVGFMPTRSLRLIKRRILVTTLHDFMVITGGCHIPMDCAEFGKCGGCPLVKGSRSYTSIISKQFRISVNSIIDRKIKVIAPSNYVKNEANRVIGDRQVKTIANCCSEKYYEIFNSEDKKLRYKSRLDLSNEIRIIGVSIKNSTKDNKGHTTLLNLIANASDNIKFYLVDCDLPESEDFQHRTNITRIPFCDEEKLIDLYVTSDLCVVPSRYETFSQVTMEALMCNTPVVAFDKTGPSSMIVHGKNGYIAPHYNSKEYLKLVLDNLDFKRTQFNFMEETNKVVFKPLSRKNIIKLHQDFYLSQ